ncbi:MAG: Peroxisomal membrane protein pex16 [Claussenomyces sp. TS43310]|nr:MAG: Peroxisomal membrane protein pex16 [Claussenomyces sp. TS43310]
MSQLPPTPPSSVSEDERAHIGHKKSTQAPKLKPGQAPARNVVVQTLSIPSEYLSKYQTFILKNSSSVSQIESALRSLTYLIPGRFRDAEIASESLHSSIQLLSLYHDSVLARAVSKLPGMPRPAPRDRYTRYWMRESKAYRRIGLFLQVLQYTELLWEMAAKRRGEKIRWRVVVILEALKALCRLLLLRVTGWRMVVPPLPEREVVPESKEAEEEEQAVEEAYGGGEPEKSRKDWTMPRTGLTIPTLPNPSEISNFLLSKVLTADDIRPATNLLGRIQGSAQLAEMLHIVRPVIYAYAMSRARDKRSWQPWLLGISVELAARQLRKDGPGQRETVLEREEWNRRGWAMGWWAMRGAFYENVTKAMVNSVAESRFTPGIVGTIIQDYSFLWDNYHFSSADM